MYFCQDYPEHEYPALLPRFCLYSYSLLSFLILYEINNICFKKEGGKKSKLFLWDVIWRLHVWSMSILLRIHLWIWKRWVINNLRSLKSIVSIWQSVCKLKTGLGIACASRLHVVGTSSLYKCKLFSLLYIEGILFLFADLGFLVAQFDNLIWLWTI